MEKLNKHFLKIEKRYLFSQIEEKLESVTKKFGQENIINLGIGDICRPICPAIKNAFIHAIEEMSDQESVKGYGPALGYPFLREAIANKYYMDLGLDSSEIFITDGINSPITQILDVFDNDCSISIPDPAYPVYLDNAILKGFSSKIQILPLIEENSFNAVPPNTRTDLVYLCSPGNPTGTAMNYNELKAWVDWANENNAIILFDAAYNCFINDQQIPKSIFEIPHAKNCCIEFMSFSKSAGFTGLRLGSVAMSQKIVARDQKKNNNTPYYLFKQYLETVSNGISYPVQKAGLAALDAQGQLQIKTDINSYKQAAQTLKTTLIDLGYKVFGGDHSPYLWVRVKGDTSCQEYCNQLLEKGVVAIAGSGFGSFGNGFFRLSCFITDKTLQKAVEFFKAGKVYGENKTELLSL